MCDALSQTCFTGIPYRADWIYLDTVSHTGPTNNAGFSGDTNRYRYA